MIILFAFFEFLTLEMFALERKNWQNCVANKYAVISFGIMQLMKEHWVTFHMTTSWLIFALTKLDFHIIILTEIYTTSIDFIRSLFLRVFSRYFKKINTNKYRLPALVVKDIYRTWCSGTALRMYQRVLWPHSSFIFN